MSIAFSDNRSLVFYLDEVAGRIKAYPCTLSMPIFRAFTRQLWKEFVTGDTLLITGVFGHCAGTYRNWLPNQCGSNGVMTSQM
jgi:hypothetical protein